MLISGNAMLPKINMTPPACGSRTRASAVEVSGRRIQQDSTEGVRSVAGPQSSMASTRTFAPEGIFANSFGSPSRVPTTFTGLAGRWP